MLTTIKGDEYIEKVEKEEGSFVLTNIFYKKTIISTSDILSGTVSKPSFIRTLLRGLTKFRPGLDIILKDGTIYYITPNGKQRFTKATSIRISR